MNDGCKNLGMINMLLAGGIKPKTIITIGHSLKIKPFEIEPFENDYSSDPVVIFLGGIDHWPGTESRPLYDIESYVESIKKPIPFEYMNQKDELPELDPYQQHKEKTDRQVYGKRRYSPSNITKPKKKRKK